jgi:ParB family chromosome partitioning protein
VQFDKERKCWRIIIGESRWRAAKLAGLTTVPCLPVVGELSETEILSDQIIENTVRHSLLPLELARAMAKLKALKRCNSQTLAAELGISGASITRSESLLTLPEDVQALVDDGRLVESAAYEISRLPDPESQREMGHMVAACRMNRDQVIEAVRQKVGKKHVQPKAGRVAGKLDGVSFSFSFSAGELTAEALLAALDKIRSKLKELQKGDHRDVSALADLLRA